MKTFCKNLNEHATRIINCEKKVIILLTNEENKSYQKQKICYICQNEFSSDDSNEIAFEKYHEVRDHCDFTCKFRYAALNVCNLRYKIQK